MSDQLTLESLQSRLEEFRRNRSSKKARIPEDIWLDACVLCETQKTSVVAKALGLRFDELKKRVEALSGEACVKKKGTSRRAGGFVELGSIGGGVVGTISLELETIAESDEVGTLIRRKSAPHSDGCRQGGNLPLFSSLN